MEFAAIHTELERLGATFIALCGDSIEQCRDLRERLELPYPIFSDPGRSATRELRRLHRTEPHARLSYRYTVYLLDGQRRLRHLYVGTSQNGKPRVNDLETLLTDA